MNSFDVFDTLIARRYITSKPIFVQLAAEFQIQDFVERRIKADTGFRDLDGIYEVMGISKEVMARELALEHEQTFPIQENIDRVAHGDMLISDMYIPGSQILSLVRHAGLEKQVTLYQSNGGKANGSLWKRLHPNPPALHLGDNRFSDFEKPMSLGINCELYEKSKLTGNEAAFGNYGLSTLGLLMREIRLREKPCLHPQLSDIACQLNLPWLFITAELLHRAYTTRDKVFLGRDCQLLYQLYDAYFRPSFYLPFSRKVAYAQPEVSVAYLKAHAPKDALLVDIRSTGGTWEALKCPLDIAVLIYLDNYKYTDQQPALPANFSYIIKSSECPSHLVLELLNCGDHGFLSEIEAYDDTLFHAVFDKNAYPTEDVIRTIHAPVRSALALKRFYQANILAQLQAIETPALLHLLKALTKAICGNKGLLDLYPHWSSSETNYHSLVVQISHNAKI